VCLTLLKQNIAGYKVPPDVALLCWQAMQMQIAASEARKSCQKARAPRITKKQAGIEGMEDSKVNLERQ